MINSKEHIIKYFESGIKASNELKIGIEHEKFLFDNQQNKRVDYQKIKEKMIGNLRGVIWEN